VTLLRDETFFPSSSGCASRIGTTAAARTKTAAADNAEILFILRTPFLRRLPRHDARCSQVCPATKGCRALPSIKNDSFPTQELQPVRSGSERSDEHALAFRRCALCGVGPGPCQCERFGLPAGGSAVCRVRRLRPGLRRSGGSSLRAPQASMLESPAVDDRGVDSED